MQRILVEAAGGWICEGSDGRYRAYRWNTELGRNQYVARFDDLDAALAFIRTS